MLRTTMWYFLGMTCVLGLLMAAGVISFATVFLFQDHVAWNWFVPLLTGLG